jgi:hypothetical protein
MMLPSIFFQLFLVAVFSDALSQQAKGFGQREGQTVTIQERARDKLAGYLTRLHDGRAAMIKAGLPVPSLRAHNPSLRVSMFTLYATSSYPTYLTLTLESMRWNRDVTFNIINIVDSLDDAKELIATASAVPNVKVLVLTLQDFIERVKERLKINPDIPTTKHLILKVLKLRLILVPRQPA